MGSDNKRVKQTKDFEMRCLTSIFGISKRDRVRNVNVRRMTKSEKKIIEVIKTKRLKWFGHVCRKQITSLVQRLLTKKTKRKTTKEMVRKMIQDGHHSPQSATLRPYKMDIEFVRRAAKGH